MMVDTTRSVSKCKMILTAIPPRLQLYGLLGFDRILYVTADILSRFVYVFAKVT